MYSIVLITKNEEENLRRLLPLLQDLTDDIVVVDSGSTDDSEQLCKQFGVRFLELEWGGYSRAKNYGNSVARYDWILSLDADEIPDSSLIKSLLDFVPSEKSVYELRRLTNFAGKWIKHCGWNPEWRIRLFNREHCSWEGDFVHEELRVPAGWQIEPIQGLLHHYSFPDLQSFYEKCNRYAELSAREMVASKRSISRVREVLAPTLRFLKTWLLKGGVLDGREGWIISRGLARMVSRKYQIYRQLKAGKGGDSKENSSG